MNLRTVVGLSALAAMFVATPAHAEGEGMVCANAAERAQRLRMETKLKAARDELRTCSRPVCPAFVRKDCDTWLGEVEASLPSVVLTARTPSGRDITQVRVFADGLTIAESLDGRALPMDPGVHVFRFETANAKAVEEKVVVKQGEKNRQVAVTLSPTSDAVAAAPNSSSPSDAPVGTTPAPDTEPSAPVPVVSWVFGGVAVVSLATALGFRVAANNAITDLRKPAPEGCAPACTDTEVDPIRGKITGSNVAFGIGVGAAALSAFFYFTRPRTPPPVQAYAVPVPGGAAAGLSGSF